MSMNEAALCYECLIDHIDIDNKAACDALSRLVDLADPQAEELRRIRKFFLDNIKELIRILDYVAWELKQ